MSHDVFRFFSRARCSAVFTNIPIGLLQEFRSVYPGKYRIRYRGPRNTPLDIKRGYLTRQASCLKAVATHFSVYHY